MHVRHVLRNLCDTTWSEWSVRAGAVQIKVWSFQKRPSVKEDGRMCTGMWAQDRSQWFAVVDMVVYLRDP